MLYKVKSVVTIAVVTAFGSSTCFKKKQGKTICVPLTLAYNNDFFIFARFSFPKWVNRRKKD